MNIGNLCKRDVVAIDSTASLQDAAMRMRERHVGTLVVTEDGPQGNHVVGIVTDRDLTIDGIACGLDPEEVPVSEIISGRTIALPYTAGIPEAIAVMRTEGVRRLLVTAQEQQLLGILSFDDVVEAVAGEMAGLAHAIHSGIARETAQRRPVEQAPAGPFRVPSEALPPAWRPVTPEI